MIGVVLLSTVASASEPLPPGTLAPRFKLPTLDGKDTMDSRDVFKKAPATVLILWDSYCPDCLATVKACQAFAERAEKTGIQVLGINYDKEGLASVRGFLKAAKIRFPNLHDRTGRVIETYRAQAYDFSFFVVDRKGIVRRAVYDHPPEIEEELEKAVNEALGENSPLRKKTMKESSGR